MTAGDFLDEKRAEIGARAEELESLVAEHDRLKAAAAAIDDIQATAPAPAVTPPPAAAAPARRSRTVPSKPKTKGRKRGRPKGSGTRRDQALALIRQNPGIKIPQLAGLMGIKPNYLYRLLPSLRDDKLVERNGKGWQASEPAAPPAE